MNSVPTELKYTKSHEWVRDHGDGTITVGITDHAQEALGDIVFVEIPELNRMVAADEATAVVDSVKAASDIYAPLAGEVIAVNMQLVETPEAINTSPYEHGWIFRVRFNDVEAFNTLLDAADRKSVV